MRDQLHLLKTRRFFPLFFTQFFGAFNDNLFKTVLVTLVTFGIGGFSGTMESKILNPLIFGLLIIPIFLFSATAGSIADKMENSKLIKILKVVEVLLMSTALLGFYLQNIYLLMGVMFLMGTQSAFFGPVKYSILPIHLEKDELIGGNGFIEMGTFLAILLGTLIGTQIVVIDNPVTKIAILVVGIAIAGLLFSLLIPNAPAANPELKVGANIAKETTKIMKFSAERRDLFLSILGISWFWLLGFVFLSQLPEIVKSGLQGNEQILMICLTTFSIGIGIGSMLCHHLLKGQIEATFVPLAALAFSIFTFDFYVATSSLNWVAEPQTLSGLSGFFSEWNNIRILLDLTAVSIFGGIYIVPLYTILQHRSKKSHRARLIAANNVFNALFMSVAAVGSVLLLKYGVSIPDLFLWMSIFNLAVFYYMCKLLPGAFIKAVLRTVLIFLFKVEVKGQNNYKAAGKRVILAPNHTSFLDGLLLGAFCPDDLTFAVNSDQMKNWWVRCLCSFINAYPLDPTNPMAIKSLIKEIKTDRRIVIFPEGRLTVTGAMMKVYEGPGLIADKSQAYVLPVRIEGAQYSRFSRLKGMVKLRWLPKITITMMPPTRLETPQNLLARERRQRAGNRLHEIMSQMMFESSPMETHLFQGLLDARALHGGKTIIAQDIQRKPINYNQLVMGSYLLGEKIALQTKQGEFVGLLMPNSLGALMAFFGLQAFGRTPAMLNFTIGAKNLVSCCQTVKLKSVYTSKVFIEQAQLQELVDALTENGILVCYLEDLKASINPLDRLKAKVFHRFPIFWFKRKFKKDFNKPAVVLFTSGSEGLPKAVLLSHKNIQANRYQLSSVVDFSAKDTMLNVLPIFHSFGLSSGMILPILSGIQVYFYPTPLHYRIIPEVAYDINATIMLGTNTFLAGYARFAHAYDFYSVRYVFAGAEKLHEDVRRVFADKYGIRIFEGYGATETAPVLTSNTPMHNIPGSVGKFMPGIEYRLEDIPGIEEGGRLFVRGPNIMLGYMLADHPGQLVPPEHGWYDTGDIIDVDEEGFVWIKGRAKRFAKIAGEMVSLNAVETYIAALSPNEQHAVIAIPNSKKGEQLILVTTKDDFDKKEIAKHANKSGYSELAVPKTILVIDKMPVLGTGKTDYVTLRSWVESQLL